MTSVWIFSTTTALLASFSVYVLRFEFAADNRTVIRCSRIFPAKRSPENGTDAARGMGIRRGRGRGLLIFGQCAKNSTSWHGRGVYVPHRVRCRAPTHVHSECFRNRPGLFVYACLTRFRPKFKFHLYDRRNDDRPAEMKRIVVLQALLLPLLVSGDFPLNGKQNDPYAARDP